MDQPESLTQLPVPPSGGAAPELPKTIHRIGGGHIANLRMKPAEEQLEPPGISVLKAVSPQEAAEQIKSAFPGATQLLEAAKLVGSASEAAIRSTGFVSCRIPRAGYLIIIA